jgi:hypothetical protein
MISANEIAETATNVPAAAASAIRPADRWRGAPGGVGPGD